jgi:hypothetical protein
MVSPAQHKPDLLIPAGYRRDRKDLTGIYVRTGSTVISTYLATIRGR